MVQRLSRYYKIYIYENSVDVSDDTLARQDDRTSDRASNCGSPASQSLKRLPSG